MGQVVHESLGNAAYTITFTAYGGKSASPSTPLRPLMPPDAESVETLFHAAGMPYAFVDFRGLPEGQLASVAHDHAAARILSDEVGLEREFRRGSVYGYHVP